MNEREEMERRLQRSARGTFALAAMLMAVWMLGAIMARPARAVTITPDYSNEGANEGFNDPTLGPQRKAAFEAALGYWSRKLGSSPVPVIVAATFDPLGGDANSATLGQAGPTSFFIDFSSSNPNYRAGTFYGSALANFLAGRDLDPTQPEIVATFNSDFDGPVVLGDSKFYYGLDANPPAGDSDFYTVALHELGHGLNFLATLGQDGTYLGSSSTSDGAPSIFDRYLTLGSDASRVRLTDRSATQRASDVISNNLFFDGTQAQSANGGPAKLFAPNPYQGGSSVSHLDEATYPGANINNLMTPVYSAPTHDAGPVALGMFGDMGWAVVPNEVSVLSSTLADANPTSASSVRFTVTFSNSVTGVDASDFSITTSGDISGAVVLGVAGSGATYTVTVGNYSGTQGTLKLNVVDDDTIRDANGPLGGTADGSFTLGSAYTLTTPAVGVASVLAVSERNGIVTGVSPPSTTQNTVASGSPLTNSYGVARASDGTIYVSNYSANSVVKIVGSTKTTLPTTGASNAPTGGTNNLQGPRDIIIGPDGNLYVGSTTNKAIVKIDPTSGVQTIVAQNSLINQPNGLAFGPDGKLYVGNGGAGILRIDVATGAQEVAATVANPSGSGFIPSPWGVAFGPGSVLFVVDRSNNRIMRLEPSSAGVVGGGAQNEVVPVNTLSSPRGLAYGSDGNLYVANNTSNAATGNIVRVPAAGGTVTTLASDGNIAGVTDVVVTPVASVNQAPINGVPATQSTPEDTPLVFNVANSRLISTSDADAGNALLSVELRPVNGRISFNTAASTNASDLRSVSVQGSTVKLLSGSVSGLNAALQNLIFTPIRNFNGTASLTVTTNDGGNTGSGGAKTDVDTITINVSPVNDAPVALADNYGTAQNTALTAASSRNVLNNDRDVDTAQASLSAAVQTNPAHGTLTLNPNGTFSYTPTANYAGRDSFTYVANDGAANSNVARVTISVIAPTSNLTDVSNSVSVQRLGIRYSFSDGRYNQEVVLQNTGTTALSPLYFVLDNLTSATLFNKTGNLSFDGSGNPYLAVAGGLAAGESKTILLQFENKTGSIVYDTRLLSGSGTP